MCIVQVAKIESERLLGDLVEKELNRRRRNATFEGAAPSVLMASSEGSSRDVWL